MKHTYYMVYTNDAPDRLICFNVTASEPDAFKTFEEVRLEMNMINVPEESSQMALYAILTHNARQRDLVARLRNFIGIEDCQEAAEIVSQMDKENMLEVLETYYMEVDADDP